MADLNDLEESPVTMAKDSKASPLIANSYTEFTYKMDKEMEQLEKDFDNKIINAREEFMKQIFSLSNLMDDNYRHTSKQIKTINKHLDHWVDDVYTKNLLLEAKIQRLVISNVISLIIGVCAILLALY